MGGDLHAANELSFSLSTNPETLSKDKCHLSLYEKHLATNMPETDKPQFTVKESTKSLTSSSYGKGPITHYESDTLVYSEARQLLSNR